MTFNCRIGQIKIASVVVCSLKRGPCVVLILIPIRRRIWRNSAEWMLSVTAHNQHTDTSTNRCWAWWAPLIYVSTEEVFWNNKSLRNIIRRIFLNIKRRRRQWPSRRRKVHGFVENIKDVNKNTLFHFVWTKCVGIESFQSSSIQRKLKLNICRGANAIKTYTMTISGQNRQQLEYSRPREAKGNEKLRRYRSDAQRAVFNQQYLIVP